MLVEEMSTFTIDVQNTEPEGPTKPKRLCPLNSSVLLDVFSEIVAESNEEQSMPTSEVERYLGMAIIDFKVGDPFIWWSQHSQEFPILSKLARRFLSAPATSVPSERLFSAAGNLHNDKRNRIMSELSEKLLFMQNNFILVGTVYHFK